MQKPRHVPEIHWWESHSEDEGTLMMLLEEFHALRTGRIEGWEYAYSIMDLGEVYVPSGKLEASDPYVSLGNSITVPIPPGRYPVKVTLVDLSLEDEEDGSHLRPAIERVAYRFSAWSCCS